MSDNGNIDNEGIEIVTSAHRICYNVLSMLADMMRY